MGLVLVATTACAFGAAQSARERLASGVSQSAEQFRDFVEHPPWIKDIRFRLSGTYFPSQVGFRGPRHFADHFIAFEAALQPHGCFYLKYLSNTNLHAPHPGGTPRAGYDARHPGFVYGSELSTRGTEKIIGASRRWAWFLTPGHTHLQIAPRRVDGHRYHAGQWRRARFWIERVRRLGMDELVGAKIHWTDARHFTGESPTRGAVAGAIVAYKHGLPGVIRYTIEAKSPSPRRFLVRYRYAPGRPFPPYETIACELTREGEGVRYTNFIDRLEVGIDSAAPEGYKPSAFLPRGQSLKSLILWTNNVRYKIDENGHYSLVDNRPPDYGALARARGWPRSVTGWFIVGGLVLIALLAWGVARRRAILRNSTRH